MPLKLAHDTIILDASCLISLYATGKIKEILEAVPKTVAVTAYVYKVESLWIYSDPDKSGQKLRETIILQPLIDEGVLKIVTTETEAEAETLVSLSMKIRDHGEVCTGAIAINRNWAIAVDDSKARRLFQEVANHLQLVYTLELVKNWTELNSSPPETIAQVLYNIRNRAAYTPQKENPLYLWWNKFYDR